MDRSIFAQHFSEAAKVARDFSRRYLEEPLPDEMLFRVHLNSSYDAHAGSDVKLYPDDSSDDRALATKQLDEEGVVELLWRGGLVPEWVDLAVVGLTEAQTIVGVVCCGRFAADEERLYYAQTGIAPFSPKGPSLPVNHVDGQRFSVYERSSCWSLDDLERVQRNAAKVWSLELHGPAFDGLPLGVNQFPRLEILELFGVRFDGAGLQSLERVPQLRHLRATLAPAPALDLTALPALRQLETLVLRNLPPALVGVARLAETIPRLRELTLAARQPVTTDSGMQLPAIERLTLELAELPSWLRIPASLGSLTVRMQAATDDALRGLLLACPEGLNSLGLRGTLATDVLFDDLQRFPSLGYLDAVDTRITKLALRRFAEQRTGFKCWPNLEL